MPALDPRFDFRIDPADEFPVGWDWQPDEGDDEAMDRAEAELMERIGRGETVKRGAA